MIRIHKLEGRFKWTTYNNTTTKDKTRPQGYKTFFILVLRLVLRTRNLCSTEYDTKNRGCKSFGVRSPPRWIWSTYSNIINYGDARDCFKNAEILRITKSNRLSRYSNTYLCKLHFKQLNEGVKSQVPYIGYTFGHAQHVCLHGRSSLTGGGSKMKCKLQKNVYE